MCSDESICLPNLLTLRVLMLYSVSILKAAPKRHLKILLITINGFASVFYMFYLSVIIVVGKVTLYFCTSYFLYRNKALYT